MVCEKEQGLRVLQKHAVKITKYYNNNDDNIQRDLANSFECIFRVFIFTFVLKLFCCKEVF